MQLRSPARAIALAVLTLGASSALLVGAPAAMAAHESANLLSYAPVAGSATPDASGRGIINYVKGISGEEPDTEWTSSFRFSGLVPDSTYTVIVRGRFAAPTVPSAICSFTANASGSGSCGARFTGLQRLAVSQLVTGSTADGAPVLQATRKGIPGVSGPGSITSSGGCREPEQAGSTCTAPGQA